MKVEPFVGDYQGFWVLTGPFHLLLCTAPWICAFVVAPVNNICSHIKLLTTLNEEDLLGELALLDNYRGFGLFLIDFWPYFLHLYPSSAIPLPKLLILRVYL